MRARFLTAAALVLCIAVAVAGDASQADSPATAGQAYAFGLNTYGALGSTAAPSPTSTYVPSLVDIPAAAGRATAASAGYYHSLVVTSTGQLFAFGENFAGELGTATDAGTDKAHSTPTLVTLPGATGGVTQAAAGQSFSLAVTSTGQLYGFGENQAGQLGNTANNGQPTPNPTPALLSLPGATGPVMQVSAGSAHSLALTSTGQAYAWGFNHYGQLGYGSNTGTDNPNPTPQLIVLPGSPGPIAQVSAGFYHTLVLTAAGQVYAFGLNQDGQLGRTDNMGGLASNPAPAAVTLPGATGPVVQIAAGGYHSLALTSTGQLYAWGENRFGELGNTTNINSDTPNTTPALVSFPAVAGKVLRIAAGDNHSLAVTSTGQVWAFGRNGVGQLGSEENHLNNQPNATPRPAELPAGTTIDDVAQGAEGAHSLAIVSGLAVLNGALPSGSPGVPYSASLSVGGGTGPYAWAAGGLPAGLAINPSSGQIAGTPTAAGSANVALAVTDAHGITATSTLALTIAAPAATTTTTTQTSAAAVKTSLVTQTVPKGAAAKIAALLKSRHYALSFKAAGAGVLVVDWYYLPKGATLTSTKHKAVLVAAGKKTFVRAGKATVTIKLTAKGIALLKSAKRLKVTAKSVFTAKHSRAVSTTKSFTLVR